MMADSPYCSVAGYRCSRLDVYAARGAWYVDAVLDDGEANLTGRVEVKVGSLTLSGTVDETNAGAFVLQRSLRIIAGAAGWRTLLPPKHYHSADGVSRASILRDIARAAGETVGDFTFPADELGEDFVRRAGAASVTLDRLVGDLEWWVDQSGVTHGGTRPTAVVDPATYQVLTYSPIHRTATISSDDVGAIWVGSVITNRLKEPQTISDLEIHVESGACRIKAYFGEAGGRSRLGDALVSLIDHVAGHKLFGTYRFRVFNDPRDNTLNLQAVRPVSGLPDVLPCATVSGIAGGRAKLNPGQIVRVAFDEGDPSMPYVSGYPNGAVGSTAPIARQGDTTVSGGPLTTVTFSVGPMATGFAAPITAPAAVAGELPVLVAGVPYLVSFGVADPVAIAADPEGAMAAFTPPTAVPPAGEPMVGYILTGSEQEIE